MGHDRLIPSRVAQPEGTPARPWAIAEDQVKVAASAVHVEVAFSLSKWPPVPVIAGVFIDSCAADGRSGLELRQASGQVRLTVPGDTVSGGGATRFPGRVAAPAWLDAERLDLVAILDALPPTTGRSTPYGRQWPCGSAF